MKVTNRIFCTLFILFLVVSPLVFGGGSGRGPSSVRALESVRQKYEAIANLDDDAKMEAIAMFPKMLEKLDPIKDKTEIEYMIHTLFGMDQTYVAVEKAEQAILRNPKLSARVSVKELERFTLIGDLDPFAKTAVMAVKAIGRHPDIEAAYQSLSKLHNYYESGRYKPAYRYFFRKEGGEKALSDSFRKLTGEHQYKEGEYVSIPNYGVGIIQGVKKRKSNQPDLLSVEIKFPQNVGYKEQLLSVPAGRVGGWQITPRKNAKMQEGDVLRFERDKLTSAEQHKYNQWFNIPVKALMYFNNGDILVTSQKKTGDEKSYLVLPKKAFEKLELFESAPKRGAALNFTDSSAFATCYIIFKGKIGVNTIFTKP